MIETISRIRNSRPATLVAGGLTVRPPASQIQLAVGVVFTAVGGLGIYRLFEASASGLDPEGEANTKI